MIYMLTVILVLVGAAASAIVIIAMWDAGAPAWFRWRQRQRAKMSVYWGGSEVVDPWPKRRD